MDQINSCASRHLPDLQKIVRNGDLKSAAVYIQLLATANATDGRYLAQRLLGVLIHHYGPFVSFDKRRLTDWVTNSDSSWAKAIERVAGDPKRLPGVVENALADLEAFGA